MQIVNTKISLGMAVYPKNGKNAEELIKSCETDMTRKKKVLIVDDHPQIARLLIYRIKNEGKFECFQASNGVEAIEKAKKVIPDLIILDIMMPKMSGYEVIGRLKENKDTQDIPIIILTAYNVEQEKIKAIFPGNIPVVRKTEGFDNLLELVKRLI